MLLRLRYRFWLRLSLRAEAITEWIDGRMWQAYNRYQYPNGDDDARP